MTVGSDETSGKRRTIRMHDPLWEALADLAQRCGTNISEEIRVSCEDRLAKAGMRVNTTTTVHNKRALTRRNGKDDSDE